MWPRVLELLNAYHIFSDTVDLDVLRAHVVKYFKGTVFFIFHSYIFSWIYFSDRKLGLEVFFKQTPVLI